MYFSVLMYTGGCWHMQRRRQTNDRLFNSQELCQTLAVSVKILIDAYMCLICYTHVQIVPWDIGVDLQMIKK